MSRRQLLALFLCSLALWTLGNGLAPELGAGRALASARLSLAQLAMAAGTVGAGWLRSSASEAVSGRFRRFRIPALWAGLAIPPGRGLALYNATGWLGGIAGSMLTGCAAQGLGLTPTLIAGACVPLVAVGLLAAAGQRGRWRRVLPLPSRAAPSVQPLPAAA